jgi:hypothetical protein
LSYNVEPKSKKLSIHVQPQRNQSLESPIETPTRLTRIEMATEHNALARGQANLNGEPLEKDFSHNGNGNGHYNNGAESFHMDDINMEHGDALRRIRTAGSISISPELFEKIYLSPQNAVKGDLRKTFANPTPL